MTVDPRRLLVLRAVHRHGGVTAAAEHLRLTPSAVSQHLARLEVETGLALIDRSRLGGGRSIRLTAMGEAVSAHADDLAAALAAAEQTVATMRGAAAGPVVVGAFPTAIRRLVAPAVAALHDSHPALRPAVVEASEPRALHDLAAGRLDLAVLEQDGDATDRSTAGIRELPLLRDPYRVVVPTAWIGASEGEIRAGPWVAGPAGSAARKALDRFIGVTGGAPDHAHECLEFPATLALVAVGLGAALVPDLALDQVSQPGVVVHPTSLDAGARVLTVAHRSGRHEPSAAVDVLLVELRRQALRPSGVQAARRLAVGVKQD